MRTVHKYPVPITDEFVVTLPEKHEVRHVGTQHGLATMWVEVDTSTPNVETVFTVEGTGHPIPDEAEWRGTWQDGNFVWHLYEIPQDSDLAIAMD